MAEKRVKKILFVCLGNICRSPAAEGIFRRLVEDAGLKDQFHIDSAGTSGRYHEGEDSDARMRAHAKERKYILTSTARQLHREDLEEYDWILTMDESNYVNTLKLTTDKNLHKKIHKMVSFCKIHKVDEVPDPYYGGEDGFRLVLDILEDACQELLLKIK